MSLRPVCTLGCQSNERVHEIERVFLLQTTFGAESLQMGMMKVFSLVPTSPLHPDVMNDDDYMRTLGFSHSAIGMPDIVYQFFPYSFLLLLVWP